VQHDLFRQRLQRQIELPLLALARQEFLEQQGVRRQRIGCLALYQRRQLVAERQQAARLEAEDRHAARDIGRERLERALPPLARLLDQPDREEGAATAQRPLVAVLRQRRIHAVPAGGEHAAGGVEILALEITVEGVGKQHDLARRRGLLQAVVAP